MSWESKVVMIYHLLVHLSSLHRWIAIHVSLSSHSMVHKITENVHRLVKYTVRLSKYSDKHNGKHDTNLLLKAVLTPHGNNIMELKFPAHREVWSY